MGHMGHSPSFTAPAEKKGGTGVAGGAVQITPSCDFVAIHPFFGKEGDVREWTKCPSSGGGELGDVREGSGVADGKN